MNELCSWLAGYRQFCHYGGAGQEPETTSDFILLRSGWITTPNFYSYHENWDISSFTYQITIHFPIIWLHHLLNISEIFYATSFHWVIFPCRGWGKWRRHSPMSDKFLSIPQDTALLLRRQEYSVQAVGDHPLLTLINYQHVPVTCSQSLLLNPALDCKLLEGREYLILLICMAPEIQNPIKDKQRKWIN